MSAKFVDRKGFESITPAGRCWRRPGKQEPVKAKPSGGALYVYAIGEQSDLRKVLSAKDSPGGLAEAPVALVTEGKLAAAVSEVPLTEFGEGPFEQKLKDPLWAAEKVMKHEKVTE